MLNCDIVKCRDMYGNEITVEKDSGIDKEFVGKIVNSVEPIQVKYFDKYMPMLVQTDNGDWIDLVCTEDMELRKGTMAFIHLGVAMKLPEGYEAHLAPRSSTYHRYHIIQVNSVGVIDNSYCGDNDEWMLPVVALEDTTIPKYARIAQFRIMKKQPKLQFTSVEHLSDNDRGGFGSTGI